MLAETNGLRMLELMVPKYVVRGETIDLQCNFNLDGEKLYSVKWYKDGNEFYRYVPQEMPPVMVFNHPGVMAIVRIPPNCSPSFAFSFGNEIVGEETRRARNL